MNTRGRIVLSLALMLFAMGVFLLVGCDKDNTITGASPSEHFAVDTSACIGCNLCAEACPHNAIQIYDGSATIIQSRCQRCGLCVNACPQNAIQ